MANYKWTSTAPVTLPGGGSPGDLTSHPGGWIDLGEYEDLWLTMTVEDSHGTFGHNVLRSMYGPDLTFSIKESEYANQLFVDGKQLPKGSVPDLNAHLDCKKQQVYAWEDLRYGGWNYQDFFFTVSSKCASIDVKSVRLTK